MVLTQYRPTGRTVKALADDIEAAIRAGRLDSGEGLPSIRTLAEELGVAAGTIAGAYASLRDRGLTESRGRHGTFVRGRPPVGSRPVGPAVGPGVVDLASGQPSPALLPRLDPLLLRGLSGPAAAPADGILPQFAAAARQRLADDGVPVGEITTSAGGLDGIQRVLVAQLRPGDAVGVEDPGWPNVLDLVPALGLRTVPMAVDGSGPRPDSVERALRAGARAVIVTTRAHNPTGACVDGARRDALRAVLARHPDTLVIEDDHAAELASVELAALAGATRSWAFVRSTSKPYGPDLRLGVVAGDPETVGRVAGRLRVGSGWVSTLLQRLVLGLWQDRSVADRVATAGLAYDSGRSELIRRLDDLGVHAVGASGLNVWVPVVDETTAVTRLLQSGWAVAPGSRFRQHSAPGVRITVGMPDTSMLSALARDVAAAVTGGPPPTYTA